MTQPQKTGTPAAAPKPAAPERIVRFADPQHDMTPAVFTSRELKALRDICRDADNDKYARDLLNAALARAEGKS